MCLSTVYRMHDGEKQLVCKNVAAVRQQEGALVFTDIMGVQPRVQAVLARNKAERHLRGGAATRRKYKK